MATARTTFEKIWARHVVAEAPGGHVLLYVDRHLLHDGSTHAFERLSRRGLRVRRPDLLFATADHYVLTSLCHRLLGRATSESGRLRLLDEAEGATKGEATASGCRERLAYPSATAAGKGVQPSMGSVGA